MMARFKFLSLVMIMAVLLPSPGTLAITPQYDLLQAIDRNEIEEVKELLKKGVSPNTRTKSSGEPALVLAARKGRLEIVKLLLEAGASPDLAERDRGVTALMIRANAGDTNTVKLLLGFRANPNKADKGQETPLMKAVRNRKYRTAEALIEGGARVDVQDLSGKSALDYALLSKSRRMISLLEGAGAT